MNQADQNRLWATVLVDEFAKNGVNSACICPGSRNTPLTLAFHDHPDIEIMSLLDERSAGFFVLGRAMNTGTITPVISTSGTATAGFHPAVMEADQAGIPMLVLTADRPPELQDSGANQTVDQTNLYGSSLRRRLPLPEPEADPRKLRSLRVSINRAIHSATQPKPGPVHINAPFRKPLEPNANTEQALNEFSEDFPLETGGRNGPFARFGKNSPILEKQDIDRLKKTIEKSKTGWILAGPCADYRREPEELLKLAEKTGFPLLADPLSGIRFHQTDRSATIFTGYDGYLDNPERPEPPELVLRCGDNPTASKPLTDYLAGIDTRQILINPDGDWTEDHFSATDVFPTTAKQLNRELELDTTSSTDKKWIQEWTEIDRRWWETVETADPEQIFEGEIMRRAIETLPGGAHCFVSNSLPIRDLNQFVPQMNKNIISHSNRGCSGIDGIISSAIGVASTTDAPLLGIVGDLAFYHDSNGLLGLDRLGINMTFLVINNNGGGIFHRLPVKEFDPPFTDSIRTPHDLDFHHLAKQYGCTYEQPGTSNKVTTTLKEHLTLPTPSIIEVSTDPEWNEDFRKQLTV